MVPRENYEIVDVWNIVGLRGTGSNDIVVEDVVRPRGVHAVDGRHRPLLRPGPGAEHLRPLQAAVPLDLHRHHHHADHRHGARAPTPSTSRCSRSACGRRTSVRRRPSTRSPRSASRARRREIDAAWALLVNNIREEQAYVAKGEKIPLETAAEGTPRPGARHASAPSTRSTRCSRPPAAARWPTAPTCSGPGATRTPAGCTPPTTPSARCRCTAPTSSGTRSTRGCTESCADFTKEARRSASAKAGEHHPATTTRPASRPTVGGGLPLVMLHGGGPGASAWTQLRRRAAGLRRGLPHPARRPARLRRLRQAAGGRQLLPATPPTTWSRCSTSSASTGSTCSATASAAVRRCGWR